MLGQGGLEHLGHHSHTVQQFRARLSFLRGFDGPLQVVEHGEQIAHERQGGVLPLVVQIASPTLASVFELRMRAKRAVVRFANFLIQALNLIAREGGIGGLGGVSIGQFGVRLCIAHDFASSVSSVRPAK
jgi:hypothetical protein